MESTVHGRTVGTYCLKTYYTMFKSSGSPKPYYFNVASLYWYNFLTNAEQALCLCRFQYTTTSIQHWACTLLVNGNSFDIQSKQQSWTWDETANKNKHGKSFLSGFFSEGVRQLILMTFDENFLLVKCRELVRYSQCLTSISHTLHESVQNTLTNGIHASSRMLARQWYPDIIYFRWNRTGLGSSIYYK